MGELPTFYKLDNESRIAAGGDSIVYRFGSLVVKDYKPTIHVDQVLAYKKATEQLVASLSTDPLTQQAEIEGEEWAIRFFANPIMDVFMPENSTDTVKTVSRYVKGPNGSEMRHGLNIHSGRIYNQLAEIGDTPEARKLMDLAQKMGDREFREVFLKETDAMELVRRIREVTGVRNLQKISGLNIKCRLDPDQHRFNLICTDFADDLENLIFPYQPIFNFYPGLDLT